MKAIINLVLLFLCMVMQISSASEVKTNLIPSSAVIRIAAKSADMNQWGPITCDVQMFVRLEQNKTEITTNEAFGLVVYLRNVSNNQIHYVQDGMPDDNALTSFSCTIKSPSGKDTTPRKMNGTFFSSPLVKLSPMQTVKLKYPPQYCCSPREAASATNKIMPSCACNN